MSYYKLDKTLRVNSVFVRLDSRNLGLAELLYRTLLDMNYTLVSDVEQAPKAKKMWERLTRDPAYMVMLKKDDDEMIPMKNFSLAYSPGNSMARILIRKR